MHLHTYMYVCNVIAGKKCPSVITLALKCLQEYEEHLHSDILEPRLPPTDIHDMQNTIPEQWSTRFLALPWDVDSFTRMKDGMACARTQHVCNATLCMYVKIRLHPQKSSQCIYVNTWLHSQKAEYAESHCRGPARRRCISVHQRAPGPSDNTDGEYKLELASSPK